MPPIQILSACVTSAEGDVAGNVARAVRLIREEVAKNGKVDLIVLPELFTCGYAATDLSPWAEDTGSPTFATFSQLASDLDAIVGWGFAEKPVEPMPGDRRVYNSFAMIEPGAAPQIVRKTHLHTATPGTATHEHDFLLPGERLGVVDTRLGRLGVMICYDGCFPEVARSLVLDGALCILWPTRSGSYLSTWGYARIRAAENATPVVMSEGGQTGTHSPLQSYTKICEGTGLFLAEGRDECMLRATLDLEQYAEYRRTGIYSWANVRSRRPELYK